MSLPHYFLVQIDVKDLPTYRAEYARHVVPLIAKHGGELLVASADALELEGARQGNWRVVIRFPTREQAIAWYESAEYAPLKKLRIESLTNGGNLALVPGREPPP
jgi:uncharacterized protein (DUF1330 family)